MNLEHHLYRVQSFMGLHVVPILKESETSPSQKLCNSQETMSFACHPGETLGSLCQNCHATTNLSNARLCRKGNPSGRSHTGFMTVKGQTGLQNESKMCDARQEKQNLWHHASATKMNYTNPGRFGQFQSPHQWMEFKRQQKTHK